MTMPGLPHDDDRSGDPRRPTRPTAQAGPSLRTAYTFMMVWFVCALIGAFCLRLFGIGRGDVGVGGVTALIGAAFVAAAVITWTVRRRR